MKTMWLRVISIPSNEYLVQPLHHGMPIWSKR